MRLERYERALVLGAAVDDTSLAHAGDLTSRGVVLARAGRDVEADEHHARALAVLERWHPGSSELAGALTNRATLLLNRGRLDELMVLFSRAFDIESGFDAGSTATATAWSNLGLVHDALGDSDRALAFSPGPWRSTRPGHRTTRHRRRPQQHRRGPAGGRSPGRRRPAPRRGAAHRPPRGSRLSGSRLRSAEPRLPPPSAGRLDEAADHYQRALAIDAAIARSSRDVALTSPTSGPPSTSAAAATTLCTFSGRPRISLHRLGLPAALARCRINRAAVLHDTGRHDEAIDVARQACAAAEETRGGRAGGPTSREQVFALQQSPFAALITWLCDRGADGDADDAFAVAEVATARSLADLLGERRRPFGDPDLPELSVAGCAGPAESMAALPRHPPAALHRRRRAAAWCQAGRDGASVSCAPLDRRRRPPRRPGRPCRRGPPPRRARRTRRARRAAAAELARSCCSARSPTGCGPGRGRILVVPVGGLFLLPFELLPQRRGNAASAPSGTSSYAPSAVGAAARHAPRRRAADRTRRVRRLRRW